MRYDFSYKTAEGAVIEFGGSSFWPEEDSFRSMKYSLKESNNKVRGFYRDLTEFDIPVAIHTDSVEEAVARCNELMRIGVNDRLNLTPGTITCGAYATRGYIVSVAFDDSDDTYGFLTNAKVTVALEDPTWTTEVTRHFIKQSSDHEAGDSDWLNYPHEYPYDYSTIDKAWQAVENNGTAPCSMRLTIFGFAENPTVRIGSNLYGVSGTVANGSYLVVDTREKEIYEVTRLGGKVNRLDNRQRGAKGGGSYIFEKVPTGRNLVTYDGSFGFDLTLIYEEDMPPFYVPKE